MESQPLVVLLGESVLMDSVAVSLAGRQMLGMIRVDPCVADITERLEFLNPDLIIFEFDTPQLSLVLSLLREQPNTLLLGLDLTTSRVIVLNSQHHTTRTMGDLCQVVQAAASKDARASEGGGPILSSR